jgi:hypothetical protein
LLPGAEVKLAVRDGDDHLAARDLSLEMGVGVVFAGAVVLVAGRRGVERGPPFQPLLVVFVETGFLVINEHARRDAPALASGPERRWSTPPAANGSFAFGGKC